MDSGIRKLIDNKKKFGSLSVGDASRITDRLKERPKKGK